MNNVVKILDTDIGIITEITNTYNAELQYGVLITFLLFTCFWVMGLYLYTFLFIRFDYYIKQSGNSNKLKIDHFYLVIFSFLFIIPFINDNYRNKILKLCINKI